MIDLATETIITLRDAAARLLVDVSTVFRWATNGSGGVRLEAVRVGSRWRTSVEALQRFADALTPARGPSPAPAPRATIRTPRQRQREIEEATRQLEERLGVRRCEACRVEIVAPKGSIPRGERAWCPMCVVTRKSATLGLRIRTFRFAARVTQQELSRRTGIALDVLRAYEHDKKPPPETHLAKLVEVLGAELVSGLVGHAQPAPGATGMGAAGAGER